MAAAKKKPMILPHIMIDMETLGHTADCVILSIGAVRFDPYGDAVGEDGFYRAITIESNLDYGRSVSQGTIKWWLGPDMTPEAKQVFFDPNAVGLDTALDELVEWMYAGVTDRHERQIIQKNNTIWANGPEFDAAILAHVLVKTHRDLPWFHWNCHSMRTWKLLPGAKDVKLPRSGAHHNAFDDALHQALTIQAITRVAFPPVTNGFGATKKVTP